MIADMNDLILPSLKRTSDNVRSERHWYKKEMEKRRQEMEDEYQAYKLEIDMVQKERMERVSVLEKEDLSESENFETEQEARIEECMQLISEMTDVIRTCSQPALLRYMEQKSLLRHTYISPVKLKSPNLQAVVSPYAEDHLRTLDRSPSYIRHKVPRKIIDPQKISSLRTGLKGHLSIGLTEDGMAWIGGFEERTLVLMDRNRKVYDRKKIKKRPYALTLMTSGDIILSPHEVDSQSVTKLRTDGSEQVVFDASPHRCLGVSVTRDQKLLICTEDGRVLRCDSDGSNVKQLYDGSDVLTAGHAIESNDGNIYISNPSKKKLVVIRKNGSLITTIERPIGNDSFYPWGLACDSMGNILSTDRSNECIYIIERTARVRELVGTYFGIIHPRWLAVDNEDNLWITTEGGVVTVIKYLQ